MIDSLRRWLAVAGGAALAGGLGGAVVGVGEATLVTCTTASNDEYWLFLFGALAYAAVGAVLGVAAAAAWYVRRGGRAAGGQPAGLAAAAGTLLPALAVMRYQVNQRLFAESLSIASLSGALTYAGIGLAAVGAAAAVALLGRGCYRRFGAVGPGAALGAIILTTWIAGRVSDRTARETPSRPPARAAAAQKNVILIVVDTLRADAAAWAGQQPGGLGALAADGVSFVNAYVQATWTRPSVATILTSLYPSEHRTVGKMDVLPDDVETIAEMLTGAGYWTAAFTTNINVTPIFNFQQGFDEFHYLAPSFYFGATDSATRLAIYKGLRQARERLTSRIWPQNFYQDAEVVDEALEAWLRGSPPEPFFLFVHYMDPHDPYFEIPFNGRGVARVSQPNPPAARRTELRTLYDQDVRYHDYHLGRLVDRLKANGLYERSVIAVTADHGEEFQEHGGWWHGTTLYEEQVRVPLVIKRAPESEAGKTRALLARSLDIVPTLLAAVGVPTGGAVRGTDLFTASAAPALLAQEALEGNRLTSLRTGSWKLITANAGNPRGLAPLELYDLETDPGEQNNLAGREPARVAELLAQLQALEAQLAAGQRRVTDTATAHAADRGT